MATRKKRKNQVEAQDHTDLVEQPVPIADQALDIIENLGETDHGSESSSTGQETGSETSTEGETGSESPGEESADGEEPKPEVVRYIQRTNGRYVELSTGEIVRWNNQLGTWREPKPVEMPPKNQWLVTVRYVGERPYQSIQKLEGRLPSRSKYVIPKNNVFKAYRMDLDILIGSGDFELV